MMLLYCCLLLISLVSCYVFEGSDISYGKFRKWVPRENSTVLLEFSTNQPDGLLLYTDDGGRDDFFELKLVEGSLRLRYNLGEGTQIINVGRHLNDGLWHRVQIKLNQQLECSLTVDGFVTQSRVVKGRDYQFGNVITNSHVFIGGLPNTFNNRLAELSLPSVVFEPRFRGAVRNIVYSSNDNINRPQDIIEWKGLVSGPGEACERHDPCQHGGFCISTDSGPLCDCKHIDFDGAFCDKEKSPAEGTFRGGEYVGYDFRESGGEPIVSTLDEISFLFKTKNSQHDALLFYSGDGVDYLSLSVREGRILLSINLGSGPLDARIHPDHLRFDDNQWHSIRIHRKVQEITASVDGIHFDRWTLAGSFTLLSSNRVTVGGFDMMRPLPGVKGVTNFIGCLRKVEYRADTLRLSLLELARAGNRLVSVSGRLNFQCLNQEDELDNNKISNSLGNVMKTLSGGTVTFTTPESFLILPSWNASRGGSLSLKIRTTEPNGLILFAKSNKDGQSDQFGLELLDGHLYVHLDLGSGGLRIQGTSDPIDDGEWHMLKLLRSGRSGTISVDDVSTDFNAKGDSTGLELDSNLYLGNVPSGVSFGHQIWSLNLKKGFVGCIRGLTINDIPTDLAAIAQQQDIGAVRPLCQVGSAGMCVSNPCLNGGKCYDGWGRFVCDCANTHHQGTICQRDSVRLMFDGLETVDVKVVEMFSGVESHDIVLRFSTVRPLGMLLSLVCLSSDYLELSLELGRMKLLVRLGDREKSLLLGVDLNDGGWHLVRVYRRGNIIRMQVDDLPPVSGEILTRQWVMWPYRLLLSSLTNPFHGQLEQIFINSVNIIEFLSLHYNVKIYKSSKNIQQPVTFKSKHTYVGLPQIRAYSNSKIYLQFKTNEPDGVLFYNGGNKKDFIAMEMQGGNIHYNIQHGNNFKHIIANQTYNNNNWHHIIIQFDHHFHNNNFIAVDGVIFGNSGDNKNGDFLHLNGVLYIGGLPDNMYDNLPKSVKSRHGYLGCLASLDFGGEYLNPTTDALVPSNMVVSGCGDANERCRSDSCSNGGICVEQWSGPGCDCEMTSYTGPTCGQESISYDFGPGRGAVLFNYQEERRPDTRGDVIAFGFLTADPDAVLVRIDSAKTNDYLEIELMDGKVRSSYNMGNKEHSIGELSRRVNDRVYHVIRLTRSGANATLQVDNWDSITRHPLHHHQQQSSVFNSQAIIHIGGKWKINKKNIDRPFQGILSGLVVNGLRVLDMATDKDPRVRLFGQVHQITSIGSIPSSNLKDDLHYMQKTTASVGGGLNDDLVYSGDRCSEEEDDEDCVSVGSGQTDELITPVYVGRSRPTTSIPIYTTRKKNRLTTCDDEDCIETGSGETTTEELVTTTRDWPTTTLKEEMTSLIEVMTSSDNHETTSLDETTRDLSTSGFVPPHPPSLPPYISRGRDFDFDLTTVSSGTVATTEKKMNETIYLADAGDSTLIIIIIIAVLMIIIVSILIIFFMCKRRDDPIYKVEDKQQQQQIQQQRQIPGQQPRKQGVKEW